MATITLGAVTLTVSRLLDWDESKVRKVPRILPVGESGDVDSDCHVTSSRVIELTYRATVAEKATLRALKEAHNWQVLSENGVPIDDVWIEKIEWNWEGDEHLDAPWLAVITLICQTV